MSVRIDLADVRVDRHDIVRKVAIEVATIAAIDLGRLPQRCAEGPDDSATNLTAGSARADAVTLRGTRCGSVPDNTPSFLMRMPGADHG